jgi:hypothetical protein
MLLRVIRCRSRGKAHLQNEAKGRAFAMRELLNRLARDFARGARVAAAFGALLVLSGTADAGGLVAGAAVLRSAAPDARVAVQGWQWGQNTGAWTYSYTPRQPWDWLWGSPPYTFPYGRQANVMYYPAAPYYYPGFQTTLGYNGHFGFPAAAQYANPPGRLHRPPLGD